MINDVLEMSRIESGRMKLEEIPCNLCLLINDLRDMFTTQMSEKNITYTVNSHDVQHPLVYCDKNRLNRVVLNLVSNAFKFTNEGGKVSVTLSELPQTMIAQATRPAPQE